MQQVKVLTTIENSSVNKDLLTGDFTIRGDIQWKPKDTNGSETCKDPVVELFIAIRNQYRNVMPLSLLPPVRENDVIRCHVLPSFVTHYTDKDELPEKFQVVMEKVFIDFAKALSIWDKRWGGMYNLYFEISEYKLCNELIETFISELCYSKAPAICSSLLFDIISQFTDASTEEVKEILNLFNASTARTLNLLT
ncbi:hypothetical protein IKE88_00170 [Candidatus Saccharibacteria bacterium]|nr:hypothetical protein [Candidatus Saccharibacteria bacterium]